jgi:hypothetical protein
MANAGRGLLVSRVLARPAEGWPERALHLPGERVEVPRPGADDPDDRLRGVVERDATLSGERSASEAVVPRRRSAGTDSVIRVAAPGETALTVTPYLPSAFAQE